MSGELGQVKAHAEGTVTRGDGDRGDGRPYDGPALAESRERFVRPVVDESVEAWRERAAEARAVEAQNDATLMQLGARHQVGVPLDRVLRLHLGVLLEHVLGDQSTPRRIEYDLDVATKLRDMLAETESQVTRSRLLDGVRLNPPAGNGRRA